MKIFAKVIVLLAFIAAGSVVVIVNTFFFAGHIALAESVAEVAAYTLAGTAVAILFAVGVEKLAAWVGGH
jgi:hypothetical protein